MILSIGDIVYCSEKGLGKVIHAVDRHYDTFPYSIVFRKTGNYYWHSRTGKCLGEAVPTITKLPLQPILRRLYEIGNNRKA